LLGRRIPILAVDLRCPAPDYIEDYRVMFSSNLRFAREHSRLLFNADCLDLPVRRSDRELKRFLAGAPANILVRYRDPQSHVARIKAYLRSLKVERWPDFDTLARHFFMAPSTLRRRLALEGQSYRGLKDQLRRDLALARLDGDEGNFAELALELGFADASAFYKAFKKWTGTTPGQYHRLMHPERAPGN
jgi:AraC-like DNA-binding protein